MKEVHTYCDVAASYIPVPPPVHCQKCERKAKLTRWVGEGGTIGLVHGLYAWWCERCCVTEQLRYAREAAERVPELEKRLEELNHE